MIHCTECLRHWNRWVLSEKETGVQRSPCRLNNPNVLLRVHMSPPPDPILSTWIQSTTSNPINPKHILGSCCNVQWSHKIIPTTYLNSRMPERISVTFWKYILHIRLLLTQNLISSNRWYWRDGCSDEWGETMIICDYVTSWSSDMMSSPVNQSACI